MLTINALIGTLSKIADSKKVPNFETIADVMNIGIMIKSESGETQLPPLTYDMRKIGDQYYISLITKPHHDPIEHQIQLMERGIDFDTIDGIGIVTKNGDGDVV